MWLLDVFPVIRTVSEPLPTEPTHKGSLSRVGPVMVLQVTSTVEGLATQNTHKLPLVLGPVVGVRFDLHH